jgi:RNA polymerase sigma factor (sigma-70 family)
MSMVRSRILVVDDEPAVAAGIQAILELHGLESESASDCDTAVTRIEQEFFPVILADLRMRSEDDGLQLIAAARRISPRSRVAAITGFADANTARRVEECGGALVLQKPFVEEELLAALTEMLQAVEAAEESACEGDLESLYLRSKGLLHKIAQGRYGFGRDDAQELIQETWLLFLEKREGIRSPQSWLTGTITNLCRREIDRRVRDRSRIGERVNEGHEPAFDSVLAVRQGLARLDQRARNLCRMIAFEQLSYDEVSRSAGLPLGSVGPLYMRARKQLRAVMS